MAEKSGIHKQVSQQQKERSPNIVSLQQVYILKHRRDIILEDIKSGSFIIQCVK